MLSQLSSVWLFGLVVALVGVATGFALRARQSHWLEKLPRRSRVLTGRSARPWDRTPAALRAFEELQTERRRLVEEQAAIRIKIRELVDGPAPTPKVREAPRRGPDPGHPSPPV